MGCEVGLSFYERALRASNDYNLMLHTFFIIPNIYFHEFQLPGYIYTLYFLTFSSGYFQVFSAILVLTLQCTSSNYYSLFKTIDNM